MSCVKKIQTTKIRIPHSHIIFKIHRKIKNLINLLSVFKRARVNKKVQFYLTFIIYQTLYAK